MTYNRNKKHKWHSNIPEQTTLGMCLTKAMSEQLDELQRRHINTYDWLDILKNGGKISFTTAGATFKLPPLKQHPHKKRIYMGE